MNSKRILTAAIAVVFLASPAFALNALQLGPGDGDWTYDIGTDTWVVGTNPFSLFAYANDDGAGANGSYAWDAAGAATQTAYLVISAIPQTAMGGGDAFDIDVENDSVALSLFDSGFGAPPIEDPNSLAPHGIFDTYFEIYQFEFDGSLTTIGNTEPPGSGGTGDGFAEEFDILINSLADGVEGVHMDLFVTEDDGIYTPGQTDDMKLVNDFAPFSHDAETGTIPEPVSLFVWSLLASAVAITLRRRR